jgi:hypothetical protein
MFDESFVTTFSALTAITVGIYIVGTAKHLWETTKVSLGLIRMLQVLSTVALVLLILLLFASLFGLRLPFSAWVGGIFAADLVVCWLIAGRIRRQLLRKQLK